MTFWHGMLIGWVLGMATIPFIMLVVAKLLACSYDNQERRRRMSESWLRERQERDAHVSPEAERWLRIREKEEAKRK